MFLDQSKLACWLGALALAAVALAEAAWSLASPQRRIEPVGRLSRYGLLLVAALCLAEVVAAIARSELPLRPLLQAAAVLVGASMVAGVALFFRHGAELLPPAARHVAYGLVGAALLGGASQQFWKSSQPEPLAFESAPHLLEAQPRPEYIAYTDQGRLVPLAQYAAAKLDPQNGKTGRASEEPIIPAGKQGKLISIGGEGGEGNCHGWVFSGGLFIVPGNCVDEILADNGYEIVAQPQTGDLIIYRDAVGAPLHTGVVKAVGDDELVLVEGKWGALGVFLHLPDDQPYSQDFAYYRSPRRGHMLQIYDAHSAEFDGGAE